MKNDASLLSEWTKKVEVFKEEATSFFKDHSGKGGGGGFQRLCECFDWNVRTFNCEYYAIMQRPFVWWQTLG